MTTAAMNLSFESNLWKTEMYETLGTASQSYATATRVSSGLQRLVLARHLYVLSNKLSRFLDSIYDAMKKVDNGAKPAGGVSRDQIEQTIRSLEYLYEITNRVCTTAKQHGLTNNSLMAGSLRTIMRREEELLDLADWIRVSLSNSAAKLDEMYASGRAELAKGEVYDLASVE